MGQMMNAADLIGLVKKQEGRFNELAQVTNADFTSECLFARQQLLKNKFTLETAGKNPNSLQAAILNVAAIGISLNPAVQHAYLVPRDGGICLDISFRGLVKLATDCGAIKWAKAELVYENDTFEWNGPALPPTHKADPFGERGAIKGGYCIAKLPDGDTLVDVMPVDEINKVRDTSKAYRNGKGPWVDWYEEMAKKTLVKRAYKSWPQTENRERLDRAIQVLNEHEGTSYTLEQQAEYLGYIRSEDALSFYLMRKRLPDHVWISLYNSGEKGQKVKLKEAAIDLEKKGVSIFNEVIASTHDAATSGDRSAMEEIIGELSESELNEMLPHMSQESQSMIEEINTEQRGVA